jgi:hypothetical protein
VTKKKVTQVVSHNHGIIVLRAVLCDTAEALEPSDVVLLLVVESPLIWVPLLAMIDSMWNSIGHHDAVKKKRQVTFFYTTARINPSVRCHPVCVSNQAG